MKPEELVAVWRLGAKDARRSARHLFEKHDYMFALFAGHLYLEKLLKALAARKLQNYPPYGHNLFNLAKSAGLDLTAEQAAFLDRVTKYNIAARYEDEKLEFRKRCTRQFCQTELAEIERFGKWLEKMF